MPAERLQVHVDGRSVEVGPQDELTVGRALDADLPVSDLRVSRRHLTIAHGPDGGWLLRDLGSRGGTFVAGEQVTSRAFHEGASIRLSDPRSGLQIEVEFRAAARAGVPADAPRGDDAERYTDDADRHTGEGERITIGRAADNDVVVEDLLVSRYHAVVHRLGPEHWEIEDLGSANGTFVEEVSAARAPLAEGQVASIARRPVQLRDGWIHQDVVEGIPALQCEQAGVVLDSGLRILDGVSFRANAGSLLAVLGPTGAGKSTLLKVLTGARRPTDGDVLIEGRDLHENPDAIRPMLGYVPQDDILHPQLTIRRALTYGAELRLPPDVSNDEITRRVDSVMGELGLTHRADVRIDRLSGGQRKRTSVALELLTAPAVLFLDEPTSGLDPGYEKSVMQLLRDLADAGRTVVVVTHSVQSLGLCDELLFLATGGHAAYRGPPGNALAAFGRADYPDVFHDLERWEAPAPPAPAAPVRRVEDESRAKGGAPDPRDPADREHWIRQFRTLTRRQCAVVAADRRVLLFFLAAVLVPALLILAVVDPGALEAGGDQPSPDARTLLGAMVVAAAAIGAANTLREIVKEQAITARERAAGVSDTAYLASKVVVFGAITAVQAALLVWIATATARGPEASAFLLPGGLELTVGVVLAALGAASLGLLLSSLVSSSEKAMALISVVFVVQWLLSGVALDLTDNPVIRPIGYLTSANWGMAAAASTTDLARLEFACEHALTVDGGDAGRAGDGGGATGDAGHAGEGEAFSEAETSEKRAEGRADAPGDGVAAGTEDERTCDARWEQGPWRWLGNIGALVVLVLAPLGVVSARLARRRES